MPESHKAERRRKQKQNAAAGIGDENGRIPVRIKTEAPIAKCSECQQEFKITKTNTEVRLHSENKHGKTVAHCFPEAEAISAELQKAAASTGGKKGKDAKTGSGKGKKAGTDDLDALLMAGVAGGPGAKKKGKK
ncbi:hypothetical protein ACHAXR_007344 [Thalassiosira sp. AJA248-18]